MDSYVETQFFNPHHHQQQQEHQHQQQQQQQNSGLLKFRSAPSSLFNEFTQNSSDSNKFNNGRISDDYSESYERKPQGLNSHIVGGGDEQSIQIQLPPQYPKHTNVTTSSSSSSSSHSPSFERSTSMEINLLTRQGNCDLNLNRQNSSPAGFFNQQTTQNGYTIMRGLGNLRVGNGAGANDESSPHASRLSMNHLPRIPEIGNESVKETSPDGVKFRHHENDAGFDSSPTAYSFVSWNDSTSDHASHLPKNGGLANRPAMLSHHLSLPKTSGEMAAVEKLLHFQDMVPCKVRAKRGCATHPRSIAERMRRNRISERMKNLQELVPNMDKQTNTADMLDLAVDYIKNLQNEYKILSDSRAKCKCVN